MRSPNVWGAVGAIALLGAILMTVQWVINANDPSGGVTINTGQSQVTPTPVVSTVVETVEAEPNAQQVAEHCLWVAVKKYPDWDPTEGNILDTLKACKEVDRDELRVMMASFVISAQANQ